MAKSALITGITGQDGGHLAELLLEKGYDVFGLIRGQFNPKRILVETEFPKVRLLEADLTDSGSLIRAVQAANPDEVYNLAAVSLPGYSFKAAELTGEVTGLGLVRLLEALRAVGKKDVKIYQASTSEMYGGMTYNRPDGGYDEKSLFHPRSPYGVAKMYAHWSAINYRESYDMFISCGILFNHEGPRRGLEFVTRKVTNATARIKLGKQKEIVMGTFDTKRDWGYAGDYVKGMWQMLQQAKPDDFVLATAETHSIRELLDLSFKEIGIDDWAPYVRQDPEFMRPAEVDLLLGNPAKAEKVLGWKREVDFPALVKMMVQHDLKLETNKN